MKRGPFEVTTTKIVYKNPWIEVREDKIIRPNGKEGLFGVVTGGSGSSIVALTEENEVYLIKEFHYALGDSSYELPSGGIDKGETALNAAKRELQEETGIIAKRWTTLGIVNPLTVLLNAPNHMFLAEGLDEGEPTDEETDLIKIEKFPFEKVLEMVDRGEITHSASVTAILKVARLKGL
ncbi:MAG: NUDIX hydrolase [bacterium]|nr:NUDIX hydrolase [bacterium]